MNKPNYLTTKKYIIEAVGGRDNIKMMSYQNGRYTLVLHDPHHINQNCLDKLELIKSFFLMDGRLHIKMAKADLVA